MDYFLTSCFCRLCWSSLVEFRNNCKAMLKNVLALPLLVPSRYFNIVKWLGIFPVNLSTLLPQVEEEIQTLSQVLAAKEKHLAEIKRKLGINSLQELRQNITKSWQDVTSTTAYVPVHYLCLSC